jgi:hypothetical protein
MSFHPRPFPGNNTTFLLPSSCEDPGHSTPKEQQCLWSGHFSERVKHYATHAACAFPCALLAVLVWMVTAYIFETARAGRIQ